MNSGIPYADSFYIDLSFCLSKCEGECNSHAKENAKLTVMAAIKYKKTVRALEKSKCLFVPYL